MERLWPPKKKSRFYGFLIIFGILIIIFLVNRDKIMDAEEKGDIHESVTEIETEEGGNIYIVSSTVSENREEQEPKYRIESYREGETLKEVIKSEYIEVLTNYDRLLHDSSYTWESGKVFDGNNVYYQAVYHIGEDEELVYAVADLAEDGEPELLIGDYWEDYSIYNPFIIYGYVNGKMESFITFDYPMMLYEGGVIEVLAGKAMYEDFSYLRMKKNSVDTEPIVYLWADRLDINSDEYIYYAYRGDEKTEITKEEFEDIRKELTSNPLEIDWKPLEGFWQEKFANFFSAKLPHLQLIENLGIRVEEDVVDANIENNIAYKALVELLNTGEEYSAIFLNMENTDTHIYLDQIVDNSNITYINTIQGGKIMCNNLNVLEEQHMEKISFSRIHEIEKGIIESFLEIDNLKIELESTYTGYIPVEELLLHSGCEKSSIWYIKQQDGNAHAATLISYEEAEALEIKEKKILMELLLDNKQQLTAVYRLLGRDYEYISYEFKEANYVNVYLCIKDRASEGNLYFDWIALPAIPVREYGYLEGDRLLLKDINFDGYEDILFIGYNDSMELYKECQGFLWNEEEKKYEYSETLPVNFDYIDEDKNRITYHTSGGVSEDNYYIYEYVDGGFREKYLHVLLEEEEVAWKYYEEGRLIQELYLFHGEGEKDTYLFRHLQTGQIEEGSWEGKGYDYYKLGKVFFSEFDFYYMG